MIHYLGRSMEKLNKMVKEKTTEKFECEYCRKEIKQRRKKI